jgi:hypothetical protein
MAIEKRFSAALEDISEIVFVCRNKECGARTSYKLSNWSKIPYKCANCASPGELPNPGTPEAQLLTELRQILLSLIGTEDASRRFDVRLEVAEPWEK